MDTDLLCESATSRYSRRKISTDDELSGLGLALGRSIGGGVHEDLDLVNHGMKPVRFNLEIAIRCDFADLFEVKSGNIVRRGRITTEWLEERSRLRTVYLNQDFCREVAILMRRNGSQTSLCKWPHQLRG